MFYHASPVEGIAVLKPHVSHHGVHRIYFSSRRENTLVYLADPVQQFCRGKGIVPAGPLEKWATYGFDCAGLLVLEEYYPDYIRQTYEGVGGYIYRAEQIPGAEPMTDIPGGFYTDREIPADGAEYIPDAYQALLEAEAAGWIHFRRYEELPDRVLVWIRKKVREEYDGSGDKPEYRAFLREKFPFLNNSTYNSLHFK